MILKQKKSFEEKKISLEELKKNEERLAKRIEGERGRLKSVQETQKIFLDLVKKGRLDSDVLVSVGKISGVAAKIQKQIMELEAERKKLQKEMEEYAKPPTEAIYKTGNSDEELVKEVFQHPYATLKCAAQCFHISKGIENKEIAERYSWLRWSLMPKTMYDDYEKYKREFNRFFIDLGVTDTRLLQWFIQNSTGYSKDPVQILKDLKVKDRNLVEWYAEYYSKKEFHHNNLAAAILLVKPVMENDISESERETRSEDIYHMDAGTNYPSKPKERPKTFVENRGRHLQMSEIAEAGNSEKAFFVSFGQWDFCYTDHRGGNVFVGAIVSESDCERMLELVRKDQLGFKRFILALSDANPISGEWVEKKSWSSEEFTQEKFDLSKYYHAKEAEDFALGLKAGTPPYLFISFDGGKKIELYEFGSGTVDRHGPGTKPET